MRVKHIWILIGIFGMSLAQAQAQSSVWQVDPNHSQATFEVKHLGITNVRGAIGIAKGTVHWDPKDPSKDSVEAELDATSVNTQSAYRDKDLKGSGFFNVAQFPTLTFKSISVTPVADGLEVNGDLTLVGVTRRVVLKVVGPTAPQKGMQGGLASGLEATTVIKRSDFHFGSNYPTAVVGDEVKITVDIEIDQK
jgi:polyisoprenoid-binding protein YceI